MNINRLIGCLAVVFVITSMSSVQCSTNWTSQSSPINFANWVDITVSDFNTDGVADIVAANPDPDEAYSMRSGLPVWLGNWNPGVSGNRFDWALSSNSSPTGWTASRAYPMNTISNPHISRVYTGNQANTMATWTIECVEPAGYSAITVISGTNEYVVEMIPEQPWYDCYHTQTDNWTFTMTVDGTFVVRSDRRGNQIARMTLGELYKSDWEEIIIRCNIVGGGLPGASDAFRMSTRPATFTMYSVHHGAEDPEHPDMVYPTEDDPRFYMGQWVQDVLLRFGFRIDPGMTSTPSVQKFETWQVIYPDGPPTNKAYSTVKTADFNQDGQMDIAAAGPDGVDVFFQTGPSVSDVGFIHNTKCPVNWNPGRMTVTLGDLDGNINPSVIQNEYWTVTYDGAVWNVYGEHVGFQPPFDHHLDPGEWPGPYCQEFRLAIESDECEPEECLYCPGDQFTFSTNRVNWSENVGPSTSGGYYTIDIGDVNRDGRMDIVASKMTGGIDVFFYNGHGWDVGGSLNYSGIINTMKLQDVDRDGRLDIIAIGQSGGIHAWRGQPGDIWSTDFGPTSTGIYTSLTLGDYNKDGLVDIAATSNEKSIFIYYLAADLQWYNRAKASTPERNRNNIGNGAVSAVKVNNSATKTEIWTLLCIESRPDSGVFQVRGDISGVQAKTAEVGKHFESDGGEVEFTIYDGPIDFALNDRFTFITGTGPLSYIKYADIDTSDLDNDGNLDLFAASSEDEGVRVWRGNGIFGWTEETPPEDSDSFGAVWASTDLNFDGNPDVVTASSDGSGVKIWVGDDVDKFVWSGWLYNPIATGRYTKVATGDFNVDGKIDLVAGNIEENKDGVWVWEGNNLGYYINRNGPTHDSGYYAVTTADFNLDGRTDIAAGHPDNGFDVWLSEPDWNWSFTTSAFNTGAYFDLVAGDLNRDGYPDLVAAKNYNSPESPGVVIYLNDRNGYFNAAPGNVIPLNSSYNFWGVDLADVDRNGVLDVLAASKVGSVGAVVYWMYVAEDGILFNGSSMSYVQPSGYDHYYGITIGDFNSDSRPDFVTGEDGHGYLQAYGYTGHTFECAFNSSQLYFDFQARDIAAADLTNDGSDDFILASKGTGVHTFKSNLSFPGTSSFQKVASPVIDGDYIGITAVDVTSDGLPDVIATSEGSGATGIDLFRSSRDFSLVTVRSTYPVSNGEWNIGADEYIYIDFNKSLDTSTITYENIQLAKGPVAMAYSIFTYNDNRTIRIDPITLELDEEFTVTIRSGVEGLHDRYGNQLDGNYDNLPQESPTDDYVFTFKTVDRVPPSIPGSVVAEPLDSAVKLYWAPNIDPKLDIDLAGYWVIWKNTEDPTERFKYYSKEELGSPPSITIRGLDNSVQYYMSVVSRDYVGNDSNYSEWVPVMPEAVKPQIWWAGMGDTYLTAEQGGDMIIMAYVVDFQGDISTVEIYWAGEPTGGYLYDDGRHGDFGANDGLYAISATLGPLSPSSRGAYQFELVATDRAGNQSFAWPYLHVLEDLPGESAKSYQRHFDAMQKQFILDTTIPFDTFGAPNPRRPSIWCAGFTMYPAADYEFGVHHCISAIVLDPDGYNNLQSVKLYWDGLDLGYFTDDGTTEDFGPGDSVVGFNLSWYGAENDPGDPEEDPNSGHWPAGEILFQIRAFDQDGNVSDPWPNFVIN